MDRVVIRVKILDPSLEVPHNIRMIQLTKKPHFSQHAFQVRFIPRKNAQSNLLDCVKVIIKQVQHLVHLSETPLSFYYSNCSIIKQFLMFYEKRFSKKWKER